MLSSSETPNSAKVTRNLKRKLEKMNRKRSLAHPFTELDMKEMIRTQVEEINELGPSAWVALHAETYEGKCKGFYEVSSAEYTKAPFEDQMRTENSEAARGMICKGTLAAKDDPIPKNVHLIEPAFDHSTLSAGFTVEKLKCVAFLEALGELLDCDADGWGALKYGAKHPLKGGFSSGILLIVNQPDHKFRELEQSHSVFSMRNEVISAFAKNCRAFKELKEDILRKVCALGYETSFSAGKGASTDDATKKGKITLQRMDLLLNWTRNSQYLMHQDSIDGVGLCYLTVIVNLTPYQSTMLVAGAEKEIQFDSIGKGAAFPGCFWHRSGETRRGTIKLGLFFKQSNFAVAVEAKKPNEPKEPAVQEPPENKGESSAVSADIP